MPAPRFGWSYAFASARTTSPLPPLGLILEPFEIIQSHSLAFAPFASHPLRPSREISPPLAIFFPKSFFPLTSIPPPLLFLPTPRSWRQAPPRLRPPSLFPQRHRPAAGQSDPLSIVPRQTPSRMFPVAYIDAVGRPPQPLPDPVPSPPPRSPPPLSGDAHNHPPPPTHPHQEESQTCALLDGMISAPFGSSPPQSLTPPLAPALPRHFPHYAFPLPQPKILQAPCPFLAPRTEFPQHSHPSMSLHSLRCSFPNRK